MDTQIFDDLNKTINALSINMGFEGGFGGRHNIKGEIAAALEKSPLSNPQKDILREAANHGTSKLVLSLSSNFSAKADPNDVTPDGIAHLLTDGIAKKIQSIRNSLHEGVNDAQEVKKIQTNMVHLKHHVETFTRTVGAIMGYKSDFSLARDHKATGLAVIYAHHKSLPALEKNIKAIEQIHGKIEVAPYPTSGVEFFKPIDIRKFFEARDNNQPTSTATFQQRGPESGSRKLPSRK